MVFESLTVNGIPFLCSVSDDLSFSACDCLSPPPPVPAEAGFRSQKLEPTRPITHGLQFPCRRHEHGSREMGLKICRGAREQLGRDAAATQVKSGEGRDRGSIRGRRHLWIICTHANGSSPMGPLASPWYR